MYRTESSFVRGVKMYGSFPFNETFLVFSEVTRFKPFNELIQSFEVFLRFFDLVPMSLNFFHCH